MSIPITEYRNAKVMNADGSRIDVEINHPEAGWIGYLLDTADTDMTIDNDALFALIGSDKVAYVAPTAEELVAEKAEEVRRDRNFQLAMMDQTVSNPLRWAAMSTEKQNEWTAYRQALLDVPQQSGFPDTVTWPEIPSI